MRQTGAQLPTAVLRLRNKPLLLEHLLAVVPVPPTFFWATVHLEPDVLYVVLGRLGHGCWGIY